MSVKLWHIYIIKCEFINFKCLVEYNFHNSRNLCEILFVKDNIPFKVINKIISFIYYEYYILNQALPFR